MNNGLGLSRCLLVSGVLLSAVSTTPSAWARVEALGDGSGTQAQLADLSLKDLMGLEVFSAASRIQTELAKAPGTVYSFSRGDFERLGVRSIDGLLEFVPGFQLNQYRKRHRSIWARGLIDRYNDKMVLLVDGVRMRHLYYGHFSLGDNFPLEKIEKVEVIVGPASSLYGANAFAGIISITTRAFSSERQVEATLEGGSNDRIKGTLLYNSDKVQAFGSYLDQRSPFRDDRKSFIGGDTLQPLDEDYTNLFAKVRPIPGLTLMLDHYQNNTPFVFIPDTQDAFVEERYTSLSALYEHGDLERGRIEISAYLTQDNAKEYEVEQQTRRDGYQERQNATTAGATITGFKRWREHHVLAMGLSWEYEEARDMDHVRYFHFADGFLDPPLTGTLLSDPNIVNNDYALFVQDVWDIRPDLSLTLGARYDWFQRFGDYLNYRAALVYTPGERQTWKFLYGTGIRTPSMREYLKVLEGTSFVAPVPDPERITTAELSFQYQWEQAGLSLTLFHNSMDDYIHEVPTPDGADEYFTNSHEPWRVSGAEGLVHLRPVENLQLRLGLSYQDAQERGTGTLPYVAPWSGSFNLSYLFARRHRVGFSLIYNAARRDENRYDEDDAGAFVSASLFGSGPINKHFDYFVGVDNLFGERIYDPAADFGSQYNTERTTREIWLRIKWKLDS